jgi:serine/threonine-protein kinase
VNQGDAARAKPEARPAGQIIRGRYRIVAPLGTGLSGAVYVADRLNSETAPSGAARAEQVALKIIHRELLRDPQLKSRFLREAEILSKLRSLHLVPLLDFGETDDGLPYMALELIQGERLDSLIRSGPLSAERAAAIAIQICEAVDSAHGAGVVHRDLKPSNVIVEKRNGGDHAKVLDFGMAKVIRGASDSLTALTQQNMVFGTPEYMAPEQVRGEEVDQRCDVYALGAILYELTTGQVPFQADTPIAVMTAHLTEQPPAPSSRSGNGSISPAVDAVVLHALAKRREQRYPSARSMAQALERALRHPMDVAGTLPPPGPEADLPYRDTLDAMVPPSRTSDADARAALSARTRSVWVAAALVAALAAILAGIAASLFMAH